MTAPVRRPHVLALIQAGGKGSRMDVLTRERPKPALPFAGSFRLIDFPLSNLRNSDIDQVWLSVQYLARVLADVVAHGKPWDLDRLRGGFKLIMPEQGAGDLVEDGFASGNAEDLLSNADEIAAENADALLVLSADHVYRLDYRDVVAAHLESGAECTVVTTEVSPEEVRHHATVTSDHSGLVTEVANKPEHPSTTTVATEVFVYTPGPLLEVLGELHRDLSREAAGRDRAAAALGDFGEHLLPALVARGRVHAYPLEGYWRDLGRPEAYVAAHRELLHEDTGLFTAGWPIITHASPREASRITGDGRVVDSLLADGCRIEGSVRDSVLGSGVWVARGARIRDSVIFDDVVIEQDARVDWAVVDSGVSIGAGAVVGGANPGQVITDEGITLIGKDSVVGARARVRRGGRLEPGSTAD